jgi:hypothetical protein
MQYYSHNDQKTPRPSGYPIGEITATYQQLVAAFGHPRSGSADYKTDAEWDVVFLDDDCIIGCCMIYNWKNGQAYNGPHGTPVEQITTWHIGGTDGAAVGLVEQAIAGRLTHQKD